MRKLFLFMSGILVWTAMSSAPVSAEAAAAAYTLAPGTVLSIGVARPQHDLNPTHNYPSEKEVLGILSDLGISEETIASHLKLLAQMGIAARGASSGFPASRAT